MKIEPQATPPSFDSGPSDEEKAKVKQVAKNFEAIFVNHLVGEMRKTVGRGEGLIPESHAEKMYQGLLDNEYSQRISDSEQLGLSKLIYDHLLRNR